MCSQVREHTTANFAFSPLFLLFLVLVVLFEVFTPLSQRHEPERSCSSVWDECNVTLCDKLQKLQNRAARVITKSSYDVSAHHLLTSLRQDNLAKGRKKLKAILMFKILNGLSPDYLQDLFSIRTTKYNVRNLEMKLNLAKPNTNYLKKSFSYSAASLWNNLPNNLRTIESVRSFKKEVNRFYDNEG